MSLYTGIATTVEGLEQRLWVDTNRYQIMASAMLVRDSRASINPETLCGIDAFRRLTLPERKALTAHCHCRRFQAGERILSYQEASRDIFFIISGRVQAINYSASGQQVTLQDLEAGQMFGELSAIDGQPRSAYVIATADSLIASMTAQNFMRLLREYPAVAEVTLKRLTQMVRKLTTQVFERDVLPANRRVRAELLRLAIVAPEDGGRAVISPAPTHSDLATHIGASRETVTREMATLKKAGLILRSGGDLLIRDIDRLSQMIGERKPGQTDSDSAF